MNESKKVFTLKDFEKLEEQHKVEVAKLAVMLNEAQAERTRLEAERTAALKAMDADKATELLLQLQCAAAKAETLNDILQAQSAAKPYSDDDVTAAANAAVAKYVAEAKPIKAEFDKAAQGMLALIRKLYAIRNRALLERQAITAKHTAFSDLWAERGYTSKLDPLPKIPNIQITDAITDGKIDPATAQALNNIERGIPMKDFE